MGGDGGTKSLQRKYLRSVGSKSKNDSASKSEILAIQWSTCHLTGEALREPIMACCLGYLYNKESVLTSLLEKTLPKNLKHIKKLKDLIPLKITSNPAHKSSKVEQSSADNYWSTSTILSGAFYCPVTYFEMNGTHPFCVLKKCGCVLSERSLKEVPSTSCIVCDTPFDKQDIVKLNPSKEELDEIVSAIKASKLEKRANKKPSHIIEKKRKRDVASNKIENENVKKSRVNLKPSIAAAVTAAISAAENKSSTYKSLFHKNTGKDTDSKDLMMCVATRRYIT